MKRIAIAAASATLLIGLAACGSQTDERVEPAASAEETAPAEDLQSSIAAETPFVTVDCVSTQAMPTDTLPTGSVTVGSASAAIQPNGAPTVTIATDATPATELGIAEVVEGSGAEAVAGDTLTVNYCGVGLGRV